MSTKNWNDRADKDLFFTILSVKNIGIISAGEWSTIGNQMRCMGYGFTNEGCRQHFQGLRRAQSKAEANGVNNLPANPYRPDPTLNPITRRPGPGRGRPKKQLGIELEVVQPIVEIPSVLSAPGIAQMQMAPTREQQVQQAGEIAVDHDTPSQPHAALATIAASAAVTAETVDAPLKVEDACDANRNAAGADNEDRDTSGDQDGVEADADGYGDDEDADGEGVDEPPVKRQRLEDSPDLGKPSAPLDDQAMLALAAHNGASGSDFQGDFPFGNV